jgi:membrane protein DedA with SNARE-associated domain
MHRLIAAVLRYGIPLVFANVFLEQIGAPIPAVPTLVIAGALARNGRLSSTHVMVAAVIASLIADWIWFLLGRRYGWRILRTLCRISLSPDSCVRDTEANFERWGMKSLLFAKFIPGFSTIAPPLAGAVGASTLTFLIFDGIGAVLWAGTAVALGRAFHRAIGLALQRLESLGGWAVVFLLSALALLIAVKWWQRMRFIKQLRVARVTVGELKAMLENGGAPVILDVRAAGARQRQPQRIPTAIVANDPDEIEQRLGDVAPSTEIILYCT